jgi:hypothetical protein
MKRMIKVLVVAVLMAAILMSSVSPAMARRINGGILLPKRETCINSANIPGAAGAHLVLDPTDRMQKGCWVELPPAADN